jgi:hypothetical protein
MCFVLIWEESETFTWQMIGRQMIGCLNWGEECLLGGTPWVFMLDRIRFVLKGLKYTDMPNSLFSLVALGAHATGLLSLA